MSNQNKLEQFPGTKVLVVDDYSVNQDLTKEMLEVLGCEVEISRTARNAIELIKQNNYDLVFMDVKMPLMNGFEATAEIRKLNNDKNDIIIIAMTAHALTGDKERCLEAGMNGYLSKPIRTADFINVLRQYAKKVELA